MTRPVEIAVTATLMAVCACGIAGTRLLWIVGDTARDLPKTVIAATDNRISDVQSDLDLQVSYMTEQLFREVAAIRTGVFSRVDTAVLKTDKRTGEALGIVRDVAVKADAQVTTLNGTAKAAQESLTPALKHAESTLAQVDDALPLYLDCEFNPDCAFNRFQGVSKAVERMAQEGAKAAPRLAANADRIADAAAGVTEEAHKTGAEVTRAAQNFNRPQTKWQQFKGLLLTAARIWGTI